MLLKRATGLVYEIADIPCPLLKHNDSNTDIVSELHSHYTFCLNRESRLVEQTWQLSGKLW